MVTKEQAKANMKRSLQTCYDNFQKHKNKKTYECCTIRAMRKYRVDIGLNPEPYDRAYRERKCEGGGGGQEEEKFRNGKSTKKLCGLTVIICAIIFIIPAVI